MRINKFLASSGLGSRRKVEELILNGKVLVNGSVVKELSTKIEESDIVKVNNNVVMPEKNFVYIMLNKPKGYLCSSVNEHGKPSVLNLISEPVRLFSVGRLDFYTEGLLLLTNDGEFANSIIHPKGEIKKTYEVIVKQKPNSLQINQLRASFNLDGYQTKPAIVSKPKQISENAFSLNVTIYEGRNRQIRKMHEQVGLKILNLKRIQIGKLTLNNLQTGKYIHLNSEQINKIFN